MCDDFTAHEEEAALQRKGLNRREFSAVGAAVVIAACSGGEGQAADGPPLEERMVSFTTGDGMADAFFVHPAKGRHPGVIMWPDIAGLREAYKVMARRLAADGYAVLVINQYYRSSPAPIMENMAQWRTPEGQEKLKPMIAQLNAGTVMRDAKACVAFLDGEGAVDTKRGIGSAGYCMGGPYTVRSAYAVPARVTACASFHGGGLVSNQPDSPHKIMAMTKASFLFAIARNDDARSPGDKDALREASKASGRPAEVEVYNADHGWCTVDAPVYDKAEADRAWARMLALFKKL